jgi:hypothetical protein
MTNTKLVRDLMTIGVPTCNIVRHSSNGRDADDYDEQKRSRRVHET